MIPPRARASLLGLTVGDAFGETFFGADGPDRVAERRLRPPPWRWTDDTTMALGLVEVLGAYGSVDPDALAAVFARNYAADPRRGYGSTAHHILQQIGRGIAWRHASGSAFGGSGSMGNGAAMRVAPLGAWFADDLDCCVRQAVVSAAPTHAHPDGAAGAVAVAIATAVATNGGTVDTLWDAVLARTPDGDTRDGLLRARGLHPDCPVLEAADALGTGGRVISCDTVPFVLWSAAQALARQDSFEDALWRTVEGLGDRDTTCAMVGGIVAARLGEAAIPAAWRAATESWPPGPWAPDASPAGIGT